VNLPCRKVLSLNRAIWNEHKVTSHTVTSSIQRSLIIDDTVSAVGRLLALLFTEEKWRYTLVYWSSCLVGRIVCVGISGLKDVLGGISRLTL
jgi:hypothetical protein